MFKISYKLILDSSGERNYLSKVVYPELRDYFYTEYGYDFQVIKIL